jgi:hypothetical protein
VNELEVTLDCFMVVAGVKKSRRGYVLHHPATPDLVLGKLQPHVYVELHGNQIVTLRPTLWGIDSQAAWMGQPEMIVPDTAWTPVVLPLPLAEFPPGWYHVDLWLGDVAARGHKIRVVHG